MSQTFGALLRMVRKRNGMTQHELAASLGYSRSLVAALELDQRLPDVDTVARTFVPALGLLESPQLAAQLVELAAHARHEHLVLPQESLSHEAGQAPRRIPIAPTRLLGRDREIELLCARFLEQDTRLLTLVGPPGVGKTRLAQAVATRVQPFFADGACFVALAGVSSPDFVADSILAALDANRSSDRPAPVRLVAHLRHKQILLLLDNFEQILAAAPQVAHLLVECSGVRVLVTSRERLHLRAEQVVRVLPLPLVAAADLFTERAHAADAGLVFPDENRSVVEAICTRLDCLPLSIELCAAQADFFSPEQLLQRVQARPLDTLADGAADLPPQHRNLRAAIQASYDLLDADERALLRVLSVFAGGCEPGMVEEVWCADPAQAGVAADALLQALAAKNLVQMEATAMGARRLLLLESVRAFARERLDLEGDAQAVQARHFDACLRLAQMAMIHVTDLEATFWAKRLDLEHDNFRVAAQWAVDRGRFLELALLIMALHFHWQRRGMGAEASDWIEQVLPHCDELPIDLHVMIKSTYGFRAVSPLRRATRDVAIRDVIGLADACEDPLVACAAWRWRAAQAPTAAAAVDAFRRSVELARAGRNRTKLAYLGGSVFNFEFVFPIRLNHFATYLLDCGETVESAALIAEGLDFNRAIGHEWGAAFDLGNLGLLALLHGEVEQARAYFQDAVDVGIQQGDVFILSNWQPYLALTTLYAGDVGAARSLLAGSLEACNEYGDQHFLAKTCCYSAEAALWEGDFEEAGRWLAQSLTHDAEIQNAVVFQIQRILLGARLTAATGADVRAARLFGRAHALSSEIHFQARGPLQSLAEAALAQVRARLGERAFYAAHAEGEQWSPAEVLATIAPPL